MIADLTPTTEVTDVPTTPTRTPAVTSTPEPSATSATVTPEETATPEVPSYTVEPGDSLQSIAERFKPEDVTTFEYAGQIASANGISVGGVITVGQVLELP